MFNNRLLGDKDALRVIKTLSGLISAFGQPPQDGPTDQLRPERSMAHMIWRRAGLIPLNQWCETSLKEITATAPDLGFAWHPVSRPTDRRDDAEEWVQTRPGEICFDPNLCDVRGEFVTHCILQVAREVVQPVTDAYGSGVKPCARSRALQFIASAAYLHRGHVILSHCRKADWHLARLAGDPRTGPSHTNKRPLDIESALIFSVVIVQLIKQQRLPQIIPLFGVGLNRVQAEKIHRAFRQGQMFEAELRLIRLMNQSRTRQRMADHFPATPVRWSYYSQASRN